jgi:RND superfamily putative drug exporter
MWSARHRKLAIWGWLGFVALSIVVGGMVSQKTISDVDGFNGESHRAEQELDRSGLRPTSEAVFVQSDKLSIDDQEFKATIQDAADRLSKTQYVQDISSPLNDGGQLTNDRRAALVEFKIPGDSEEARDRVDPSLAAVKAVQARHPDLLVEQFGDASGYKAVNDTVTDDLAKAGELSIPVTLIVLVIAFGTLVAAGLPLLLGITAVIAALMLVNIPSHISPIDDNLPAVILLIGLAVGVDYSLFYVRREREERAAGRSPEQALEIAAATSGRAVLISGLTVIVAMMGMLISGDKTFIAFTMGTVLVVALAVLASLTFLPAMLSWLGDRIDKGRIPYLAKRRNQAGKSRLWSAITTRVMRRPGLAFILAAGFLVVLAIPALQLKTVVSGVEDLPQDIPVIKTYNQIKGVFPTEGVTATVVVDADNVRQGDAAKGIANLNRQLQASIYPPGPEVTYSDDKTVAKIDVPIPGNGTDAASTAALNDIRDDIIPATIGPAVADVNVTGDTAASVDFTEQLNSRLPLIFAFVLGLAFLLMLVTFRSIVIPIKAIILNLLSVGAAYGVLVFIFQRGHLESALGFHSNGGVTNWLPLFLFVILFGLSMDYHVFILSRVKELHDRGMPTDEAVRQGISTTAGTVTSAAAVMVAVFAVFITLEFIDFKELGVGLAVAVLIDATIIRGILLPASMKLLGDWNWYLPKWLEWLPRISHEPEDIPPVQQPALQG